MADSVNWHLERMLPEIEDLEKRGLFSRSEIKEIVRRRQDFEYKLRRRAKIAEDYLRYIDYEKKLEALRLIRKKVLVRDLDAAGERWKPSISDRAGVLRIIKLYRRALLKFNADLQLWFQYLEYCKDKGTTRMQEAFAKALQLHPYVPGLWMYAAAWDFSKNRNVTAARALMQRGLRMCPSSEDLWLQYFRMELTYLRKLKARKLVLGIGADEKTDDPESLLGIKLAEVIYQNAIATIPSSPCFRQKFVEVLDSFDMGDSSLTESICNGLLEDFPVSETCWDWRARRCNQNWGWRKASKVYEDALRAVSSSTMYELYIRFLEGLLDGDCKDREEVVASLSQLYEQAERKSPTIALVEGHVRFLSRLGFSDQAKNVSIVQCDGLLAACPKLWSLRLSVEIGTPDADDDHIFKVFKKAVKRVDVCKSQDLWHTALQYFFGRKSHFEGLTRLLEAVLGGKGAGKALAGVAAAVIDCYLHGHGIRSARKVYNRMLALPGPSSELFLHCGRLEARSAASGDAEALSFMRNVFNAALEIYGKLDRGLWLEYCAQEREVGTADAASKLYYRAKKTLLDPSSFVERHQLMFP